MDDPAARARGDRAAGPHPARHRPVVPDPLRPVGRRHLHARHGWLGLERASSSAPRAGRRPRWPGRLDPPAVLDRRLLRRRPLPAHLARSTPPSATRASSPSAAPRCSSRTSSSGCSSPPTAPAHLHARRGGPARLARRPRGGDHCAGPGIERCPERPRGPLGGSTPRFAATPRGWSAPQRAHDRFAEVLLARGGIDDVTRALGELLGDWVLLVGEDGGQRSVFGAPALGRTSALKVFRWPPASPRVDW